MAIPGVGTISPTRTVTGSAARVDKELGIDLDPDPQEAYYISLLRRFTALSVTLRSPLPADASSSLSSGDIIHSIRKWRWVLLHRQPTMTLLSQLPQESVVNGLAALESVLQRGELRKKDGQRLGAWAWGLLARCREVGEMGSEEVGVLRGLGKTAWWVMREIKAGIEEVNEEEIEDGVDDGVEDGEVRSEEGEVRSEEDEQGLDDDDDHDVDGENTEGLESPNHVTPTSFNDAFATAAIDQTTITSSPGYPNLVPTEPPNGHQNPSSSPPRDPPSNDPSDPLLAAAQQRLLALLSPFSPSPHSSSFEERRLPPEEQQQQKPSSPHHISSKYTEGRENGVDGGNDEVDTETEKEKQVRINATLDMILTIVGERYGQKDLLIGRGFWGE